MDKSKTTADVEMRSGATSSTDSDGAAQLRTEDLQNVLAIGLLGAGKSTVMSALFYQDYDIRKIQESDSKLFEASKSTKGFTQHFTQMYSPYLNCLVTDSPGLGDANIPLNLWIEQFNLQVQRNNRVDMCMLVIEKKERVSVQDVTTIKMIDEFLGLKQPNNLCIIFNKCVEDEDDIDSVKEFYADLVTQGKCSEALKNLPEENMLLLYKQKLGKKSQKLDEVPDDANNLIRYVQKVLPEFISNRLPHVQACTAKEGEVKALLDVDESYKEEMKKEVEQQTAAYKENEIEMKKKIEESKEHMQQMQDKHNQQMAQMAAAAKQSGPGGFAGLVGSLVSTGLSAIGF